MIINPWKAQSEITSLANRLDEAQARVDVALRRRSVMELDTAGIIRTVNEVCCALLQVQKEALIGRSFDEVLAATSENKSERRSFLSALQSGADQTIHYSYRPGGGEPLWLQADFAPFSQKLEGSQRIQVFISDITRQRQDALLLHELKAELQAVRDVQLVAEFDPDGRVRNVNSVFVSLFGYAHGEIIGRFHAELVGDEVAHSAEYRAMWDQLRMGKPFVGVVRRIAKSGQELYLQASYNPITNAEGRVVKVVKYAQDVTRQTALSISLSRAVTEVQAVLTPAMAGDWSHRVREDDKGDDVRVLVVDINRLLSSTESFIADLDTTLAAIGAGRLDARADANRHQGGFRSNVQRMNASLDAVTTPLNVAASYLDRISKGDLPPAISEVYHGDFNAIKGNLNTCIAAVTALVADAGMLSTAAVEGKLATRADASKHQGDFRKIVQGVNETLDAVIGPLNVAASYVDRISKGDIPAPITDSYNGDFNTIKNNLNQAIAAVNSLVSDAGMLSTAAVDGKLATRADASKHQGDFRKIVQGVNDTLDAVIGPLNVAASYVDRISKGDIPAPITDSYNGDFNTIKSNLNQAISAVNKLVADAGMLSTAAVEGKLATRADATKHQGDFRKIVQGVNDTLDAVIGPLNVAASYVDRISKGDIPAPITDSYNGDFNTIKNNLNQAIDAVNKLVADAGMLSTAAVEGKLATRADATKHQGDFRKIVQGVNETLDAVIGPLNVAANYVDRISKGDIPAPITDSYNGDFNTIKNNLNQAISAVNSLVSDAGMLSLAAVEGKLATRADATKHQGDFRKIVQGVNETLDAVIGPLNVAASYVDRISKGDIPAPISDSYNGDFNTIKNNLNQAIDAVNKLVADAGMLSTAAVQGKLATRADASKHQGDFRKIVQGVNETLDAVIGPLNVAASYVDRISKGDIPAPITDSYNGDFNTIKNNLNQAIDAVNKLVADADMLSTAAVQGKLATRADASKHQGDFRKIVQGVNETLDAVIGPLEVAAGDVDRIAKGDIPAAITDSYNGDFNTIKNNLNQAIDAVNKLVADAGMLSTAAVEGKLATRADATKHQGDFRKIVQGVNETLDAVIGPLGVAADVVDRIARGDIPPPITDSYNGDFNNIKNNLNTCISAVNMLVADAGMLSSAAVEGNLATRADATKHQGDFRKIVQGVNETLDAVIAPINETGRVLSALAQGDLTETIRTNYRGDFDKMVQDTNRTVVQLSQIVSSIQQATASINLAAREIASGNIDLSSRTEQQAASLEETASSMEELTSTVRLNAENAKQANQLALGASDVARKGGMVVGEVVGTMSDIQASSKKIVDIISVIDGIAFQTNILALNAAVEAARAGEQGRGFAVVAAEVRSLAQRSAGAAKEIKTLIGDSVEKVGNGSRLVEQAGRTMEEIVSSVKRVTDIMGEISAASQEQSLGIEQVNKTVTQMDEVTQQNASLVEEASA